MLQNVLPDSLPIRAWLAIFTITGLCLLSTFSSGILAWASESDAQAINTAGSIRMATYRINYRLTTERLNRKQRGASTAVGTQVNDETDLVVDMQARIDKLREYQQATTNQHEAITKQLNNIESQWDNILKPALLVQDDQRFYQASLRYIADVDNFVSQLQYRNEKRQNWQQIIQLTSLVLTIFIMLVGMHELRQNVLIPVRKLIKANSSFKRGKLDTDVTINGYAEFRALGNSFNDMARTIESYQSSLKSEVQTKTQHLVKANQVLSLLYDFAKHLTTSQVSLHKLDSLIADFGEILPYLEFTLCIQNEVLNNQDSIALHGDEMKELCNKLACHNCQLKHHIHTKSYPIIHQKVQFGELRVTPKPMEMVNAAAGELVAFDSEQSPQRIKTIENTVAAVMEENNELIIALTNLISTALSMRRQRQQEHQLILFEERSTIARELHDSLAQSLSYLKIQVSVLEKHLAKVTQREQEKNADIWQHTTQIKAGLNSAYQELRELLVTFRLTINNDSFDEALHEAANEFALKGKFDIIVTNRVMSLNLSATEQVDLIQIAREALSNISRHAQAKNVEVLLGYNEEKTHIIMSITDDGIGISNSKDIDLSQHHGLMIMKERAHNLGGTLTISDYVPSGTVVTTEFVPEFFDKNMSKE